MKRHINITPTIITVVYLLTGGLWILFSDRLVLLFAANPENTALLQTFKGWFFIGLTGLVIYSLSGWSIAELKKQNLKLQESEKRFRTLVNSTSTIVWTTSNNGEVKDSSEWRKATGQTEDEARNHGWMDAVHPDDRERTREVWFQAIKDKTLYENEFRIRRRDGKYGHYLVRGTPIFADEDEIREWIGVCIDISELKFLEEQLRQSQKMEAVGQLTGGIAHDFNNLLTAIIGYGDLALRQAGDNQSLKRSIVEIKRASERAADLTRQLLAFSRKQILNPKTLNLNQIVAGVENMIQRLIGASIELETRLDPELKNVFIDPGQIEQVIINLAINARDAMPHGGMLVIETSNVFKDEFAASDSGTENCVMLSVTDTGYGMDEQTKAHIFEPFFTTKEVGKGTGLGLSTVYGIVKQSGGTIQFQSEYGKGARFSIYLPVSGQAQPSTKETVDNQTALSSLNKSA